MDRVVLDEMGMKVKTYETPFGNVVYVKDLDRDPPDLLPLILLELRKVREILIENTATGQLGWLGNVLQRTEGEWVDQMKNLGHWDDRYD